ncbi:MAG: chemotaxis protein CheW [bacterium]|nr:MAG: hypothetical protein DIU52_09425 [bacterium]
MDSVTALAGGAAIASPAVPDAVLFTCGGHLFALPLTAVREVLDPRPLTRLPGCGPEVAGLVNLRGRVLTVFDLGGVLGLGHSCVRGDHHLLHLAHDERLVAFAVDRVLGVKRAAVDELSIDAEALSALDIDPDGVIGIGAHDGAPFVLLDPDHLFRRLLT